MGAAKALNWARDRKREMRGFVSTIGGKVTAMTTGAAAATNVVAFRMFAADPVVGADVTTSVISGMDGVKVAALAVLAGVLGIGLAMFAGPFVVGYGKRILKLASRGS